MMDKARKSALRSIIKSYRMHESEKVRAGAVASQLKECLDYIEKLEGEIEARDRGEARLLRSVDKALKQ